MATTRFDRLILAMTLVIPTFSPASYAQTDPAQLPPAETNQSVVESAAEEPIPFNVFEIRVGGNSLLDKRRIERAVYPHLGPSRTIDDIEAARIALEQVYRDAGYPTVLVDIPPQDVGDDGVVRLKVTEGRLDRVRVTGARYYSNRKILAGLPSVAPGKTIHAPQLEQELATLAQRARSRSVVPVIKAGRQPGTVDLELKVADELPLTVSVDLNDRTTIDTVPLRMNLNVQYSNLWQKDHSIGLQYQVTPEDPDQISVLGLSYLLRPQDSANVFAFYAVRSNSDFLASGQFGVLGEGDILGFRAVRPLAAAGAWDAGSIVLGFDYKKFNDQIVLTDEDRLVTPIEYMVFNAGWSSRVQALGGSMMLDANMNFGVPGVFNSRAEFEDKRFKAAPNFFYLTGGLAHTLPLGNRFSLQARLRGQLSDAPLIGNEQLSAGGADSVRGYFEAEQLADYGLNASLQLNVVWPRRESSRLSWRSYAFADWSGLAVHQPLPGEDQRFELASAGLGLDVQTDSGITGALQWAWPLHDAFRTQADDHRFLFRLMYATP